MVQEQAEELVLGHSEPMGGASSAWAMAHHRCHWWAVGCQ